MPVEPRSGYVSAILDDVVRVERLPRTLSSALRRMGFRRSWFWGRTWERRCVGQADLAATLDGLRRLELCFAGAPHGWPPAAVFEHLREQGLLQGSYRQVVWLDQRRISVSER